MNELNGTEAVPLMLVGSAPPIAGRAAAAGANGQQGTTGVNGSPLPAGGGHGAPSQGMDPTILFILVGFFILMIVMSTISGRKEKKRRAEMLASLAKHDKVQTLGGIIGTIVDLRDDEVVLKVDESNNTRITFVRSAVQAILKKRGEASPGKPAEAEVVLEGKA